MPTNQPMSRGDLAFLSNYDPAPFWMPRLQEAVLSGEHAFNALKTTNPAEQAHVLSAPTPGEAKRRGRRVTLRRDWNTGGRVLAMQHVLRSKFAPHSDLARRLVATGGLALVETNHWHDQFWGDCTCPAHATVPGTNMLGELLMAIRSMNR
ncbi:NADAR family protein [Streptomyces sp. NPDC059970]|uniref:NADAR family protein n=1 Tax=Streptomyces sp. NPDC059970 TaxID=3347019 RepID=UPI00367E7CC2